MKQHASNKKPHAPEGSPPRGLSLETVLEATTDSVFVLDREWRFAYLNRRARDQIAQGRDLIGRSIWDAFPEGRESAFWETCNAAMNGAAAACEQFYPPLRAWFEARAYPIETGVAVFFRDISARRTAETEQENLLGQPEYEHALLEAIIQQLPTGVVVAEPGGRIVLHNAAAVGLLGRGVEAGQDLSTFRQFGALHADGSLYTPEDYPIMRALTRGEEVEREPMLYRRGDGSVAKFMVSARPTRNEHGEVVTAVATFDDVTELQDSIERHRLALAAANMGDWQWDAATDLMSFSPRAREIFGFREGETMTRARLRSFVDQDDLARAEATIDHAAQGRTRYRVEYRYTRPHDGVTCWLVTMGFATSRPDGSLSGITGVVLDVTERKRIEERQELLIRELHHRVKNTLATVQAIVGATARSAPSPEHFAAAFAGRVISLAKTHDLLTEGAWQTASLRQMLERELGPYDDPARPRIALEGPLVELSSEEAVPLGMAIHELTTNAAKYGALSRTGGRLQVTWTLEPPAGGSDASTLRLAWIERGGPPAAVPRRLGFGSRLLNRVLAAQLQAEVDTRFPPEGFELRLAAPIRGRAKTPFAPPESVRLA
ncbi:MAG TPA: HWE histidine kinase domain-containing protein [Beijerinckiaceae bacterium]|nr:HWE histidine kinase domain-containing protein [Beijerinckiaceae bacterium]